MEYSDEARAICTALNDFHLPRAIAHLERNRFVAWNEHFLAESGFSGEELQTTALKDLTTFEEPSTVAPGFERSGFSVMPFRFTCHDQDRVLSGNAAAKGDGFVLLLVEPTKETGDSAWEKGRNDERDRILRLFHDEVGPKLLAAVFAAQIAKEELEAKGLKESETVAKVGDKLVEAIEGVVAVLDPENPTLPAASQSQP
jgi:hypothetical protein